MPSSRKPRFSEEARDDLRELLQYSFEAWGRYQRDRYKALIQRTLRNLARHPDMGRVRDEIAPGLRSFPVGVHIIFYREDAGTIIVRRIIHGRRDVTDELP